jgi:4'-phosphopantetheinyl transferase EntD
MEERDIRRFGRMCRRPCAHHFCCAHGERTFVVYRVKGQTTRRLLAPRWLQQAGLQKGDCVATAMRNLPEWPAVVFGSLFVAYAQGTVRSSSSDRSSERQRAGKAAVDRERLAVDVGRFVAGEK